MNFLSLLLFALTPHAAEVNGELIIQMDGRVRYCQQASDTKGVATAYTMANPQMRLDGDTLHVEAQFAFLRCGNLGNKVMWKIQSIFEPVQYEIYPHLVTVFYSYPEILLINRSEKLLNSAPIQGLPFSETVILNAKLSDILNRRQKAELARNGLVNFDFGLFLRLRTAYSADGDAPVNQGEQTWGGFTIRARLQQDAKGNLSVFLLK
jgi:hypothetical protein